MKKFLFPLLSQVFYAVDRSILSRVSPKSRERFFGLAWSIKSRYFDSFGKRDLSDDAFPAAPMRRKNVSKKLPGWLSDEIADMQACVDPLLYERGAPVASAWQNLIPLRAEPYDAYQVLLEQIPEDVTHIILVPWLKRGGADLVAIKHAKAIAEGGGKPVVMATEDSDSPWADRLTGVAEFIAFGEATRELSRTESQMVLTRLLIQSGVAVLHNINSRLAWECLRKFGNSIATELKVFVSLYCHDRISESGRPIGYAHDFVVSCDRFIHGYISDNRSYLDYLVEKYGVSPDRTHVAYVSTDKPQYTWGSSQATTRRPMLLWAGRLDRQKRPDLLVSIAQKMPEIDFEVFGYSLLSADAKSLKALKKIPNVHLRGGFDGFDALPYEKCAAMLYTSAWDGVPNILLEAGIRGMPLVASNAGGISELLDDTTGWLVLDIEDVDAYVSSLREIIGNPIVADQRGSALQRRVAERHNDDAFIRSMTAIPGYGIDPNAPLKAVA